MEHINTIHGPEAVDKNMEISSICYITKANLIVVGTDVGLTYFWDLTNSRYVKLDEVDKNHNYITHISYSKITKGKDLVFVTGLNGFISVWELEKEELKNKSLLKKETEEKNSLASYGMLNKSQLDKMSAKEFNQLRELIFQEDKRNQQHKDSLRGGHHNPIVTTYSYLPNLRYVVNTNKILKESKIFSSKNEIYCCQYSTLSNLIYSGGENGKLFAWNYVNGVLKGELQGHKSSISCMVIDKNILISGDRSGLICIFATETASLIFCLENPNNLNARILDMLMISEFGMLVTINSYKQLEFWRYESKELIKVIPVTKELNCLAFVNHYGKLLCGTMDYTIFEEDLSEVFNNSQINHKFTKFPFLSNKRNYMPSENQKEDDNHKIMKSINNEILKY